MRIKDQRKESFRYLDIDILNKKTQKLSEMYLKNESIKS